MFRWSQFSLSWLDSYEVHDLKAILEMVGPEFEEELQPLSDILPWPESAITAFSVFNYTRDQEMEACLAHGIREDLGLYWNKGLHVYYGGWSVKHSMSFHGKESVWLQEQGSQSVEARQYSYC